MPNPHWAQHFSVDSDDLEYLLGLLLEQETPLSTEELARALIQWHLDQEITRLEERYKDTLAYNPSQTYKAGQKLVFPAMDYATAVVTDVRAGENTEYGDFEVIAVQFDGKAETSLREFASSLTVPHRLSEEALSGTSPLMMSDAEPPTADEIMDTLGSQIITRLQERLQATPNLVKGAGRWFPRDLLVHIDEGHLNLAEAVLDLAGGGPLSAERILGEIGGLGGDSPLLLQTFSLNITLRDDDRFDEVGPAGQILWYLRRMKPEPVRQTPALLRYRPVEFDEALFSPAMRQLVNDIDDELSNVPVEAEGKTTARITLIYPHRRVGTLPLNAKMRAVFQTALQAPHIWLTLVDGQDEEAFPGWVVSGGGYVYGLLDYYRKHQLPIGAYIEVRPGKTPGSIVVDFDSYRKRTEYIRLISVENNQIQFEHSRRTIGAEFDELMIIGADDLKALDELSERTKDRTLVSLLRELLQALSRLTPQATVHSKTLYSAVNMLRRVPPGLMLATLVANPEFEDVGGDYWRLRGSN